MDAAWLVALVVGTLAFVPAAHAGTPPPEFSDNAVATGLTSPTAIAILPGASGRFLVTEKGGALKLVDGGAVIERALAQAGGGGHQ